MTTVSSKNGGTVMPITIPSLYDTLAVQARNVQEDLDELLSHSRLERRFGRESGLVGAVTSSPFGWGPLSGEGRTIQLRLREQYVHFADVFRLVIQAERRTDLHILNQLDTEIMWVIDQEGSPWQTIDETKRAMHGSLLGLLHYLDTFPAAAETDVIVVPDANALLFNPALEHWTWDGIPRFTIALTPTVLEELDRLQNHERVQEKAERLIREIKEYRRRGRLTDGVPLRNGVSSIYAVVAQPHMMAALPWLDSTHQDDRLLATVFQIAARYLRRPVALVTRDINLQNKAEFAGFAFLEPPVAG